MKKNLLNLPQLLVKTSHSIFEATISMDQLIEFSLKNNHKFSFFTESQYIKHFPTFHLKASNKGLIPLLSLHYIWKNSSEWLLIPKNFEGYNSLSNFTKNGTSLKEKDWSQIVKIFISGDDSSRPWKENDFFLSNSDCQKGVHVRENIFLKEEDYELFCLVTSIKNKSNFFRELELNSHLKNSFLLDNPLGSDNIQWIKNLLEILRECNYYSLRKKSEIIPPEKTKKKEILDYCSSKLEEYISFFSSPEKEKYRKRFEREVKLFELKNYWEYFYIVWTLAKYLKKSNILVSPGRGSSCSSLLIFLMGINQIDPIKYGLLLDRFSNESSERMPDLDIDIEGSKRLEVLKFLRDTFGEKKFIIPSIIKRIKNINLISSALEKIASEGEEIDSKLVSKLIDLPFLLQPHPSSIIPLFEPFLEGTYKDSNCIFEVCPLEYSSTSYIDLQKFDLLSSQYLEFISEILKEVFLTSRQLSEIDFSDSKTWNFLKKGLTYYLFHLDSSHIKNIISFFELKSISDLAQLLAIIRPGINKHISKFLNYKGQNSINLFPTIKDLLLETRGIILFQEQIMSIVSVMTGMSLANSDKYRIVLQKQKISDLAELKKEFFSLALLNKKSISEINEVWKFINTFGKYSFNKSHAVAYAVLSFQAAYLKANYSEKFYISALKREGLTSDCLEEIISLGYKVKTVSCKNKTSYIGFFDSEKKEFYIGFNGIKFGGLQLFQIISKIDEKELQENCLNLETLISFLLSKGLTKEDIEKLNYFDWFSPVFSGDENLLYIAYEWDSIYKKIIFQEDKKEFKEFSQEQNEAFLEERKRNLNFKLEYLLNKV